MPEPDFAMSMQNPLVPATEFGKRLSASRVGRLSELGLGRPPVLGVSARRLAGAPCAGWRAEFDHTRDATENALPDIAVHLAIRQRAIGAANHVLAVSPELSGDSMNIGSVNC